MKKIVLLLTIALSSLTVKAQDNIIMRNGDTLNVKVVKTTADYIEFKYPNEDIVNQEYKNAIIKIIYQSGRIENCSSESKLAVINGIEDWEKVEITTNPDDVRGLTKVGEVVGKSGWGGNMAQGLGNKIAREKLKKNAAKLKASIVLLQEKADLWGVKLVGMAYK